MEPYSRTTLCSQKPKHRTSGKVPLAGSAGHSYINCSICTRLKRINLNFNDKDFNDCSFSFQSYIHGSSQAQFVAETHIVLLFSILELGLYLHAYRLFVTIVRNMSTHLKLLPACPLVCSNVRIDILAAHFKCKRHRCTIGLQFTTSPSHPNVETWVCVNVL